jgi:hypothetical protein
MRDIYPINLFQIKVTENIIDINSNFISIYGLQLQM